MNQLTNTEAQRDEGFTLVEILIAIVLVGILSAVVVVGIGSLTDSGNESACKASYDAAKAAAVVHFASEGTYPTGFGEMATSDALELPADATYDDTTDPSKPTLTADGWTLTMTVNGTAKPTFACS